ncbi:MAG: histidine--tRNA ligase [Myxococcales bacterium]|nr:histidine--tRNA ligase [Myxococcales bacterium]
MTILRAVKGMNDVLPEDIPRWRRIEETFWSTVARHGYGEVRTPIVEPTALFVRGIGEVTDIVEKEMYTFVDKGENTLTMRPEGTASAVRAYLQHSVAGKEPVTKWAYLGPMFRRERPARGRYRQFWQAGVEVFGDPGPYSDAEMIDMVVSMMRQLGVEDVEVLINSLGSGDTRARYLDALTAYLTPHEARLSEDSKRRLRTNPLRVLDSKAAEDKEVAAEAPRILDFLGDEDRAHLDGLLGTLEALGTPYRMEPTLVRGLDYYSRTLFEVVGHGGELGAQNTLCGGGRYDGLVEVLGGPPTPGLGFAMGLERLLLVMSQDENPSAIDAFVVYRPGLETEATKLLKVLRDGGIGADADLRGGSIKSQFRRADKSGARLALILGPDEVASGVVTVKDLARGKQEAVARDGLLDRARALLRRESV